MTFQSEFNRILQPLRLPPPPDRSVSPVNFQQYDRDYVPRFTIDISNISLILDQVIDPWIRIFICNEGTGIIHAQNCIQIKDVRNEVHLMMNVDYSLLMIHQSIIMIEIMDRFKINKLSSEASNGLIEEILIAWSFLKYSKNNWTDDFAISAKLDVLKYQTDSWYIRRCAKSLGVSSSAPKVYIQYLYKKLVPSKGSITVHVDPTTTQQCETNSNTFDKDSTDQVSSSKDYDIEIQDNKVPKILVHRFQNSGATAIGFSHAGSHLALVTNQNRVFIHELETGSVTYRAPYSHQDCVHTLVWSENDIIICCASKDGTISTYNLQESNHWKTMKFFTLGLDRTPTSLSNMNHSPFILIGCNDGRVSIFDLYKSEEVKVLEGHEDKVTAMTTEIVQKEDDEVNADSREISLFSGDVTGAIVFWRIKFISYQNRVQFETQILRKLTNQPELRGRNISNLSIMYSKQADSGRKILINTNSRYESLFIYDLERHVFESFGVHSSIRKVGFVNTVFCSGGNFVLGGTRDGTIILMDSDGIKMEVRHISWLLFLSSCME